MKRPNVSKNPENKKVSKAIGGFLKETLTLGNIPGPVTRYLNKVSGAAMFDPGGKHGPKKAKKNKPAKKKAWHR